MHELITLLNTMIDKLETREMEERRGSRLANHPSQLDVANAEVRLNAAYVYRLLIADLVAVRTQMVEGHVDSLHALLTETIAVDPTLDEGAILRLIPKED